MSHNYQRLATLRPNNTSENTLYTASAGSQIIGALNVCNQQSSEQRFYVGQKASSGVLNGDDYLFYYKSIPANDVITIPGITLNQNEPLIVALNSANNINFVFSGLEITNYVGNRTYGRIHSLRPATSSEELFYTIPINSQIVSTVMVCNQDSSSQSFSFAHSLASSPSAEIHDWLFLDHPLPAYESIQITGLTAKVGEQFRIRASIADKISFVLSGLKIVTT